MVNKEIKLEVSSKFRQAFSGNSGLEFEILSIDEPNNALQPLFLFPPYSVGIKCTHKNTRHILLGYKGN